MSRSLLNQDTQIRNARVYLDNLAAGSTLETNAASGNDDADALRSQINRVLRADGSLNWYDDVPTVNTKKRGLYDLNFDLDDIEEKRFLFRTQLLTDVSVPAGVAATGVLTFLSQPNNGDTVTIDTKTYTFVTSLTDVDGYVLIDGVSASNTIDNLIAAINLGPGAGTVYALSTTLHPTVSASAGAGDTMNATAKVEGTNGNTIATTESTSGVRLSWGGATLSGGAGDVVVLSAASSEVPTETAAVNAGNAEGAVVATLSGDVGSFALTEVSGANAIRPKNLVLIVDGSTRETIEGSDGRDIWGLLQAESGVVDGDTFNDSDHQVQISFVKLNSTGDDLIPADGADIGGKSINYAYVQRTSLDNIPEQAFLTGIFVDLAGATTVSRQTAYDQQGTTPVDLTTNATLDLESAGIFWKIRDNAEADLFVITEGSAGGTSTVAVENDVDVFDIDAVTTDFANEIKVDTGGVEIDIGVTAGHIETTGANDLHLNGARELYFDDGNQSGWTDTNGVKLSEDAASWTNYKTAFGEVSLMDAIYQASFKENRHKSVAVVTAAVIPADTNVTGAGGSPNIDAQLGDYSGVTFVDDVDIFLNGQLQRCGADAAANHDVYPGDTPANGDLKFEMVVRINDVITMIIWGTSA